VTWAFSFAAYSSVLLGGLCFGGMWKKSTAVIKNYVTGASKSRAIGAVCIGLAVGLVCNHLGVTGWKLHAIPILTMFGCYMLTAGHKW
jgi:predicted MFS family arabinose efflux permease